MLSRARATPRIACFANVCWFVSHMCCTLLTPFHHLSSSLPHTVYVSADFQKPLLSIVSWIVDVLLRCYCCWCFFFLRSLSIVYGERNYCEPIVCAFVIQCHQTCYGSENERHTIKIVIDSNLHTNLVRKSNDVWKKRNTHRSISNGLSLSLTNHPPPLHSLYITLPFSCAVYHKSMWINSNVNKTGNQVEKISQQQQQWENWDDFKLNLVEMMPDLTFPAISVFSHRNR